MIKVNRNDDVTTIKGLNSQQKENVMMKKVNEIEGFELYSNFTIFSDGRLYNELTKRFLKGNDKSGYLKYSLSQCGIRKNVEAHKLVALAFVDGYFESAEVDHIDRDKLNNNYTNLRWVTRKENQQNKKYLNKQKKRFIIAEKIGSETPQLFKTIASASRELGIKHHGIYKCCYGTRLTTGGYKFYFVER